MQADLTLLGLHGSPLAHLRHDADAGRAVPTAVAHFHLVQVAGALGDVAQLREMPAGGCLPLCGKKVSTEGGSRAERKGLDEGTLCKGDTVDLRGT